MPVHLRTGEPAAGPWRVVSVSWLTAALLDTAGPVAGRPVVLAVDGRSSSGKSTLARRICDSRADAAVVHTDDIAWWHSRFGWVDLIVDGVLTPARAGLPVSYRPPQWRSRGRAGSIDVPEKCGVLVVEGVGAARRELTDLIDAAIWVQADEHQTERRNLDRVGRPGDSPTVEAMRGWMAEEIPFVAEQRTWERADVVVNGTSDLPHDPATQVVVATPAR